MGQPHSQPQTSTQLQASNKKINNPSSSIFSHCCSNVDRVDRQLLLNMKGIIEPEDYKKSKNQTGVNPNDMLDNVSMFEGTQIQNIQPQLNQYILHTLHQRQQMPQSSRLNDTILTHIMIKSQYLQLLQKQTNLKKDDITMTSFLFSSGNNTNKIQYRPIYFKFKKTGIIYHGQWKTIKTQKLPHGKGCSYYPNQSYYEGLFKEGIPHYYGLYVNQFGDQYQGEIKYGRANGSGIYISYNNQQHKQITNQLSTDEAVQYRGQFKDNQKHGQGIQKSSQYYFEGTFQYDEKVFGILKYHGSTYQGQFYNGTYHGKGRLSQANDSSVYQGQFKNGKQNGYGQYKWKDGNQYRGNFFDGKREGFGEYYNAKNQSTARGTWKNSKLQGNGQYIQRNGQKVKCIWQNNKIVDVIN